MVGRAYPVVLEWIDHLGELKSAQEAWQSFLSFSGRYGYSFGAIADTPRPRWRRSDNVLMVSWPESWVERYAAGKFLRRDPSVRAMFYTREPYTWHEGLAFDDYSRAERNIVFEAADHGLHSGFVVPITEIESGSAVVTVAGEPTRLSKRERAELHMAAIYAQAQIRMLAGHKRLRPERPHLTIRERECLEWVAEGKSDWEIGEILSIAERTAGRHIESAKQKMGVATRIQAVVRALQTGAISV
jgi:LuxR family transcriptional regulator, quorum-sensing system regulator BjaR1